MVYLMIDERVHYECDTCCYGVSGYPISFTVEDKLDKHEDENPGHRMKEAKDE